MQEVQEVEESAEVPDLPTTTDTNDYDDVLGEGEIDSGASTTSSGNPDEGYTFGVGPAAAVAVGGAILVASAVFLGRRRQMNQGQGADDGTEQHPEDVQDNDQV